VSDLKRMTIFVDHAHDGPSDGFNWVQAWLARWQGAVRVAKYSTGGWEHLWDIEGPAEAVAEVPDDLVCASKWANPEVFGA
jgi:hypothetical protein